MSLIIDMMDSLRQALVINAVASNRNFAEAQAEWEQQKEKRKKLKRKLLSLFAFSLLMNAVNLIIYLLADFGTKEVILTILQFSVIRGIIHFNKLSRFCYAVDGL
jgi:tryptophan-rich sensory protein